MAQRDEEMHLLIEHTFTVTDEHIARWRAALERLGPNNIRDRLRKTTTFDPNEEVVIDEHEPPPSRRFVEDWLYELVELRLAISGPQRKPA